MLRYTFCRVVLLLFLFTQGYAQDNFRLTSYTMEDGVPQSTVHDIIQDKEGFMWLTTSEGIARFDGYNFKVYNNNPKDPTSICDNLTHSLYVDSNGTMWMTSFRGIDRYNTIKDNFKNVVHYDPGNVYSYNHIYGEAGRYIWAGLCNYGLVKIDKYTNECSRISLPHFKPRPEYSWFRGFIENGEIWVCHNDSCFIYNIQHNTSSRINLMLRNVINLNDSEVFGVTQYDAVVMNKKNHSYSTIPVNADRSPHNVLGITRLSPSSVVLSSTTNGLIYIDTKERKISRKIDYTDNKDRKIKLFSLCSYTDRSGNLWIGTKNNGLAKLNAPFKKFKLYRSTNGSSSVNGLFVNDNLVFVGYYGNGFDIFSRKGGHIKNINIANHLPSIVNGGSIIAPLGQKKILMLGSDTHTDKKSVPFSYDITSGSLKILGQSIEYIIPKNSVKGLYRPFIFKDIDGSLLTDIDGYLIKLKLAGNDKITPEIVNYFENEMLICCYRDKAGMLWVGTFSSVFYFKKGIWNKVKLPATVEVKSICQDRFNNMWLASPNGIYVIDSNHRFVKYYDEENGLVNRHLYGMLRDDSDNIWFSHDRGLSVYKWKENLFRHFRAQDGIQADEFNVGAYLKTTDGELFFGGVNGVTSFYPNDILDNPNQPTLKITSIKLFDQLYKTDTAYPLIHSLVLPYTENSLSFEFAGLEFTNPKENSYSYVMEGLDKKWIFSGDGHFARYPAMPPGHYIFKVKAANNDGHWGEPTAIYITIVPPYWQRTWFIILCIALGVSTIVAIALFIQSLRYRKQRREYEVQQKIQSERERISRDLHDNVGTQLSIINKVITSVTNPSHTVSNNEGMQKLESIQQTSTEVINNLRETIWALNKQQITLDEFSDKLKSFLSKQLGMHPGIKLHFNEDLDRHIIVLGPAEALHLFRICQEAIINVLKYAEANTLDITVKGATGKYTVIIADNGIGFDNTLATRENSYGLNNMRFRAAEINCDINIDTMSMKGTKIVVAKK